MKIIFVVSVITFVVGFFNSYNLITNGGAEYLISWAWVMGPLLVGGVTLLALLIYYHRKKEKKLTNFHQIFSGDRISWR